MKSTRTWTYTGLRTQTEIWAQVCRYKLFELRRVIRHWEDSRLVGPLEDPPPPKPPTGPTFADRSIDTLERTALRTINTIERLERLTYPTRWERIEDDSMNPLE